tara:strand:+ start:95 stop:733 length:639 start_codon:yes stop_codon:yes gene_type:complete
MNIIHRGIASKKLKENCYKSFKESFNKKYGIETDIHFTKDNKIICFHDFTLNRLFKINKSIKNLNYDEIKNKTRSKISVPLLKDVLKLSKKRYLVFIEIKPILNLGKIKILLNEIKNYKNCIIISFKHINLFKILKINKKVKIGFSFSKSSKISDIIKASSKKNYDYLILDKYFLNNKSIQNVKKNKYFYTIKEKKELLKYKKNYNLIFENL